MRALSTNEQFKALLILALLYLVPTTQDIYSRQTEFGWQLMASAATWLVCFYWAPFLLFIQLIQLKQKLRWSVNNTVEIILELTGFVGLMFLGINLVNLLLNQIFPGFTIEPVQRAASAILWGIFIYSLYRLWLMQQNLQQEQLLRKEAQLKALKNQLNPHFLFNSLNTISSFMHQSPDKADEVLLNLADILRYSLDTGELEKIALSEELMITRAYLEIEQARFDQDLHVNFEIDPNTVTIKVPPLLLQPLVENCIKHAKVLPLTVHIKTRRTADQLHIEITDNGQGFSEAMIEAQPQTKSNSGHGLHITQQRLNILANRSLTLSNQSGACVEISLEATC